MKAYPMTMPNNDTGKAVRAFINLLLDKKLIDAVLAPKRIPSGESFAYEIMNNKKAIDMCTPLPPIMPIQGARVLKELTRKGKLTLKTLCVMRPCEIRAAVELAKLHQVNLDNVIFLSFDCPGAFPTKVYIDKSEDYDASFNEVLKTFSSEQLRATCSTCTNFTDENVPVDLHVAKLGLSDNSLIILALSKKAEEIFQTADLESSDVPPEREGKIKQIRQQRAQNREKSFTEISQATCDMDNLDNYFANCINCHNCMRVCPICYCRQCFFESSDMVRNEADNYLMRADKKGAIVFPPDKILFHLGRMAHMSISCIGCGACEDACAMDVPVARIFDYMAEKTRELFEYLPGRDVQEPIPVLIYNEDELHEYEDAKGTE